AGARRLDIDLQVLRFRNSDEVNEALERGVRAGATAIVALSSPMVIGCSKSIAQMTTRNQLPAIYPFREFADSGGLLSYGPKLRDFFLRAAFFVDKILHGAKVANLPIEQPTTFE